MRILVHNIKRAGFPFARLVLFFLYDWALLGCSSLAGHTSILPLSELVSTKPTPPRRCLHQGFRNLSNAKETGVRTWSEHLPPSHAKISCSATLDVQADAMGESEEELTHHHFWLVVCKFHPQSTAFWTTRKIASTATMSQRLTTNKTNPCTHSVHEPPWYAHYAPVRRCLHDGKTCAEAAV